MAVGIAPPQVADPEPEPIQVEDPLRDARYRLTIDQYERMGRAGIIGEEEPVFLWKGHLVRHMTKGRPHTIALTQLYRATIRVVPDGWYVEQEQPVAIPDDGMPEPDLAIIRGTPGTYPDRAPTALDVALIAEVADSSLAADRGEMLEEYARQGVPVYWVVNLRDRRIEIYAEPFGPGASPPGYRVCHVYGPGDEVPVVLDGRDVGRVAVAAILP